ncbi:hypothetical protein [Mesorhizobium sp. CO1-1-8]|uniref:hypothetical protein n=1 Tax=Mesorhizobium sp. CO1-1-8 TaxID=2876631 RepID=UPI001CD191EB|nr:hypothetical protein [Mesorhizobium sp. CO1-1-8]MBZ9776827.1 hypothetical protein [Mesorhizobium sp. CO1-1-8]
MTTMLERRQAATGGSGRPQSSVSLVEQKRSLEQATRKTAGLASRVFKRTLEAEVKKIREK